MTNELKSLAKNTECFLNNCHEAENLTWEHFGGGVNIDKFLLCPKHYQMFHDDDITRITECRWCRFYKFFKISPKCFDHQISYG